MDLKPENIFIDREFNIKVADFDLAQRLDKPQLDLNGGTSLYMPPEYFENKIKDGIKFDIFSAGVILFIMVCGHPPFKSTEILDPLYKLFKEKKFIKFWSIHEKSKKVDPKFKQLMNTMFSEDYEKRPSISEILKSEWCMEPLPEKEIIKKEIEERLSLKKSY